MCVCMCVYVCVCFVVKKQNVCMYGMYVCRSQPRLQDLKYLIACMYVCRYNIILHGRQHCDCMYVCMYVCMYICNIYNICMYDVFS